MAHPPFKFGSVELATGNEAPVHYPNIWAREKTTGPDRLIVAPSRDHIDVMMRLMRAMPEPFLLLYVLLVSRTDSETGRYESTTPVSRGESETFLRQFKQFFEHDGRHHIWVMSASSPALIVYDHHDVLYAYEDIARFENEIVQLNMNQAEYVRFPVPHAHYYNGEFDQAETDLLNYWDWSRTPLRPGDDA